MLLHAMARNRVRRASYTPFPTGAQDEAATGRFTVEYWFHHADVTVEPGIRHAERFAPRPMNAHCIRRDRTSGRSLSARRHVVSTIGRKRFEFVVTE